MRRLALIMIGLAACAGLHPSHAADAPAIVIPGKAGVPVIINGIDASYCIVEGEFGLDRPGHMPPTIVACPPVAPELDPDGRGYFPAFGRRPGYGRYEIVPPPNRKLPPPAQDYYREWGTQSEMVPPSVDPPANYEINVAPLVDPHGRHRRRDDRRHDARDHRRDRSHP
jgi:hypothetical protein